MQRQTYARYIVLGVLWIAGFVICCNEKPLRHLPSDLPTTTFVYGGDVTFARRINDALLNERGRARIFGDVQPILKRADIALVNGEGVIASGGVFTDKGEPRPYMFRVHPKMIEVLSTAGIDVVAAGNNHSGDYGRHALREMLDRLSMAGIDYTGAGYNFQDAKQPAYRVVGDTVVAIVGADMTYVKTFRAKPDMPGTLFLGTAKIAEHADAIVDGLTEVLRQARRHAHVVLLTPHWGDSWVDKPSKELRSLAAKLIRAGYDGILGHSAHWFHGVEIIDGKPVIYDAGNLLVDYGGADDAHRSLLWELEINRAGVNRIKGYPLWLNKNEATLAKGKKQKEILDVLAERSLALGTKLKVDNGVALASCDPGKIRGPVGRPPPPERFKPRSIRRAPSNIILDKLPADVTRVNIGYADGIRLIGYKLLCEELSAPKAAQIVMLYWLTEKKIERSYKIHLEARGLHQKTGKPAKQYATHLPGDWLLPTNKWPVGKVIRDWTLIRLTFKPAGDVEFYTGLLGRGVLKPESTDRSLVNDNLVPLGSSTYRKGAKRVFAALKDYRKSFIATE